MPLSQISTLLLLIMLFPISVFAEDKPHVTAHQTLEKYVWLTKIKKELSQKSCEADQYFMHCFDVDQATCLQFTEIYLTACMDNLAPQIPAILTPKEAQKWGPMLVFCSHDLYTRFMADKKKSMPECESPELEPQGN